MNTRVVPEEKAKIINHWQTIIASLHAQSEAERQIERIKSLCAEQGCELRGEGFEWSDGCAAGRAALSEEILEILGDKAE